MKYPRVMNPFFSKSESAKISIFVDFFSYQHVLMKIIYNFQLMKTVEGVHLIWYVLKRMLKIPILKIFAIRIFNAKSSIRHCSFKEKKTEIENRFIFSIFNEFFTCMPGRRIRYSVASIGTQRKGRENSLTSVRIYVSHQKFLIYVKTRYIFDKLMILLPLQRDISL